VNALALLTQLGRLGPPSETRRGAPAVAAAELDLDQVLLTSIRDRLLVPEAAHGGDGLMDALRERPVALEYPLVEGEIMRRRHGELVRAAAGRQTLGDTLGWSVYVAAPVLVDGQPIGFVHGRRDRELADADAEALETFAVCFALVFERAVLRHRLRVQRQEMRRMASWAEARTADLGDRAITLTHDVDPSAADVAVREAGSTDGALRDLLTRREHDVMVLMVRGETNAGIARDLVLSEGTVKFHVKNILRKLHAANRGEAISRYMRLTLNHADTR
jgi:DNA-binding CsgD family transcriptional regulator